MNINFNNLSDDELDSLFRQSAKKEHLDFEDEAWSKMEKKLDNAKITSSLHSKIFNKRTYSIIILLLLFSTSILIFNSNYFQNSAAKKQYKASKNTAINIVDNSNQSNEAQKSTEKIEEKKTNLYEKGKGKSDPKANDIENKKGGATIAVKKLDKKSASNLAETSSTENEVLTSKTIAAENIKTDKNIVRNRVTLSTQKLQNLATTSANNHPFSLKRKQSSENTSINGFSGKDKNKVAVAPNDKVSKENNFVLTENSENENINFATSNDLKSNKNKINYNSPETNLEVEKLKDFSTVELINSSKKNKLLETNYGELNIVVPNSDLPIAKEAKTILKKGIGIRVAYSPDLSKISTNAIDNIGNNFGLFLEYRFSNRFLVTTGIIKSKKYYDAYPEQYNWPWGKPASPVVDVQVACKMLDIPINIRYDFLIKPRNRLFVGTGATTYIMENEAYLYNFQNGKNRKWAGKTGRYNFSNINMMVGAEKQLTKHFSLQAEPFAKIPISKIGFGKVKLITFGILSSAKYHF